MDDSARKPRLNPEDDRYVRRVRAMKKISWIILANVIVLSGCLVERVVDVECSPDLCGEELMCCDVMRDGEMSCYCSPTGNCRIPR